MSQLVFDGTHHTLTLVKSDGTQLGGPWPANNVVDRSATMRYLPNGRYGVADPASPHRHGSAVDRKGVLEDSSTGAYGPYGIIRLRPFHLGKTRHAGVGIHSGRANKGAQNHPTMGCVRTTDQAMSAIVHYIPSDPLTAVIVKNNHDQTNVHPHQSGDAHTLPKTIGRPAQVTAWV
jgi:hypothetical protein